MKITFENPRHEILVNDYDLLCKKYNKHDANYADSIISTMDILAAADTLFEIPSTFHPHPLKGEYKGSFAVNVTNKYRIIFKPNNTDDHNYRIDNYRNIKAILIIEIFKDYH